jgi:hypothetical protein
LRGPVVSGGQGRVPVGPALEAGGLRVGPHADLHYMLPLDKIICEEQSLGILSSQLIKSLFGQNIYLFFLLLCELVITSLFELA